MSDRPVETLLLKRSDVAALLGMRECIDAVEAAFREHADGKLDRPGILGMHVPAGSFHVKAASLNSYFAAKTNANFPGNAAAHGLPTIQGAIRSASTLALIGCGAQSGAQLRAVAAVRTLRRVLVSDMDIARAERFAEEQGKALGIAIEVAKDLPAALAVSDICVTCTTSRRYIIDHAWVAPGCFIAAVGADNEHKQEIDPVLFRAARVVVDSLEQCATIGDLHHALDAGVMTRGEVHAELGEIVAGRKPGRTSDDEIIVFDSTGTALQDVAAAAAVYRRALEHGVGNRFPFNA